MLRISHLPHLCFALALSASSLAQHAPAHALVHPIAPSSPAPAFSRPDLSHRTITLADYRGKVVLLNFWASWCAPCLTEMPQFAAWQTRYGPHGLQVLGVSMDDSAAPAERVVTRLKLSYPVLMGDEKLGNAFGGVLGLPETFLIDQKGKVHSIYKSADDLKAIEHEIQTLLATP